MQAPCKGASAKGATESHLKQSLGVLWGSEDVTDGRPCLLPHPRADAAGIGVGPGRQILGAAWEQLGLHNGPTGLLVLPAVAYGPVFAGRALFPTSGPPPEKLTRYR